MIKNHSANLELLTQAQVGNEDQFIADIRYHGVKKSEREDLEAKLGLVKGSQITPNLSLIHI